MSRDFYAFLSRGHLHLSISAVWPENTSQNPNDIFGININQQALVIRSLQIYWVVQNDKIIAMGDSKIQKLIAI